MAAAGGGCAEGAGNRSPPHRTPGRRSPGQGQQCLHHLEYLKPPAVAGLTEADAWPMLYHPAPMRPRAPRVLHLCKSRSAGHGLAI